MMQRSALAHNLHDKCLNYLQERAKALSHILRHVLTWIFHSVLLPHFMSIVPRQKRKWTGRAMTGKRSGLSEKNWVYISHQVVTRRTAFIQERKIERNPTQAYYFIPTPVSSSVAKSCYHIMYFYIFKWTLFCKKNSRLSGSAASI